nr:MAG TPA: hypothetical protein [Caudoviricetes sp.]
MGFSETQNLTKRLSCASAQYLIKCLNVRQI